MDYTTKEDMIYLKDLVFAALYRWKAMVAAALVLGLVLGGYQAVTGLRELRDEEEMAARQEAYDQALKEYQNNLEQQNGIVADLKEDLENKQHYADNSLYMQLDPYGFYVSTVTVYVDTDYQIVPELTYQNTNKIVALLHAYHATLLSDPMIEELAQVVQTEPRYLRELYTVSGNAEHQDITITCMYSNKAGAEALQAASFAQLQALTAEYNTSITEHTIQIMEKSVSCRIDTELLTKQREVAQDIEEIKEDLLEAETELTAIAEPVQPEMSVSAVAKKAIVFAAVGAVLGVILIAGRAWIVHIASNRVYSVRSLENRTGVKVLGALGHTAWKNPVDRKLRRWEGRQASDPHAHMRALVQDVVHRSGNIKRLLLAGGSDDEVKKLIAEALELAMPGVFVCDCGSILYCADAVDALAQADAVLLIEQCGRSSYVGVTQQCQKISDYGKVNLGCILIDG